MQWTVFPSRTLEGALRVPGDKSISHRLALLSLLTTGKNRIRGFLPSADCLATLSAVEQLGAEIGNDSEGIVIKGCGGRLRSPAGEIDCGNSGTGMRLLPGLLAGFPVQAVLSGDASLCARPMNRILEPLRAMGARVSSVNGSGRAPLRVEGGGLRGIDYALPVASAQVKSCLLLAGLTASGETLVREPALSRDHTERLFQALGLPLEVHGSVIHLHGTGGGVPEIPARDFDVPGDFSSAAFWLTAAAVRSGGRVSVRHVGVNPRRTALLDVLRRMGADVRLSSPSDSMPRATDSEPWEPRADIAVRGHRLQAFEIGGTVIPNLIDEIPVLCVAAARAEGESVIRDAAELRVKETDRIAAMAEVLECFGVPVETRKDGMRIRGTQNPLRGGQTIDCRSDHRIAMAACLLALAADSPTMVTGVECVATSYPGFYEDLLCLSGHGL